MAAVLPGLGWAAYAYWTRQWEQIDPHVEPAEFTALSGGRVRVTGRQTVRALDGAVLSEGIVLHTYVFRAGLIARMDINEPGPYRA